VLLQNLERQKEHYRGLSTSLQEIVSIVSIWFDVFSLSTGVQADCDISLVANLSAGRVIELVGL